MPTASCRAEAKLLQGVLTCTAEPWWWDRSKCSHGPEVPCSGPRGCRVLESVAEEQRRLWSARRRETLNMARTYAIRQLRREGWGEETWPTLLVWVLEDQSRGVPHLHFVLGHTTALEKAFARAFFRELKSAAYVQGLGHTSTYERAVLEQGKYEAGRLRNYVDEARALPRQGGGRGGVSVPAHGRARLLRRAVALPALRRDDDSRSAVAPGVGGSPGLLRNAEDDGGAGASRRASARAGCRCAECAVSEPARPRSPSDRVSWGPRVSEASAGLARTGPGGLSIRPRALWVRRLSSCLEELQASPRPCA